MPPIASPSIRETQLAQTLVDLADALVDDFDVIELLTSVTERTVEVADASIARLLLIAPGGELRVIARSSDALRALELTELQSGEGPSWECVQTGLAVVNQDLATASGRWARFAPAALDAGFHSCHAVPLRVRGTTFGALSFLRVDDGSLDSGDVAAVQALADVATLAILQHRVALEDVDQQLADALDSRVLIEQAANVVAEVAGDDVEPAFRRLRNHARSSRFRLVDVAVDVVSGVLPATTIAPPSPRRRASDAPTRPGPLTARERTATKATLATMSHAVEQLALGAGPDATVVALFQRAPHFAPMARTYTELAASCAVVVTAFVGPALDIAGLVHVPLHADDPVAERWGVVLLTPTAAAFVSGRQLDTLAPAGHTLEGRRQFEASWGFDRIGAAAEARSMLLALGDGLPAATRDQIAGAITRAEVTPTLRAERSLGHAALVVAERLDVADRRLADSVARADAEAPSEHRDVVTGLVNAGGADRWLGGASLHGVPMPPLGVVTIDLAELGALAAEHHDRLLQAVAAALLRSTRPGDLVVRAGPARFAVLCAGLGGDELSVVTDRLVAAASAVSVDGHRVGASGVAEICRDRPLAIAVGAPDR